MISEEKKGGGVVAIKNVGGCGLWRGCMIYFCKQVRLSLWETCHNKPSGNKFGQRQSQTQISSAF